MLDIGFLELMLIGIVGLLVLGPERLPKAARTTGMWIGKIKRTVSGMQREITAQLEAEELRQKLSDQQQKLDKSLQQAKRDVESIAGSASTTARPAGEKRDTEKRVEDARAHLDDALQTVHEEPSAPVASTSKAPDAPTDPEPKKDSTPHE
ncbi:Sec-independent protein translocase protein TatB [Vreelandella sp. EE22]